MSRTEIKLVLAERFGFDNNPDLNQRNSQYAKANLDRREFAVPALVFGLLNNLGCKAQQPFEKTAWIYSFSVRGQNCFVSSEKFGLRLYVPAQLGESFRNLVQGMLIVGLQSYSNILQKQIDQDIVGLHDFGITNQTGFLRRGYKLFRSKAEEAYNLGKHRGERQDSQNGASFSVTFNQEPWWYSFGATVSYFSYLEHLYAGLFAFTGKRHTALELQYFISLSWRKKHVTLLREADAYDAGQFNRLLAIFDQQRNLFSHGLGGKKVSSIYRFIPEVGFVPSSLGKELLQPTFMYSEEHQDVFRANCREFDAFDEFLSQSSLSHGIEWAMSGMNFRFDTKFMEEMESALTNGEFEKFLEWQSYLFDKAANFE